MEIPQPSQFFHPINNGRRGDPALQRRQVHRMLEDWAAIVRHRDSLVEAALEAGISAREIQRVTGIARTTITRIAAGTP